MPFVCNRKIMFIMIVIVLMHIHTLYSKLKWNSVMSVLVIIYVQLNFAIYKINQSTCKQTYSIFLFTPCINVRVYLYFVTKHKKQPNPTPGHETHATDGTNDNNVYMKNVNITQFVM